MDRFQNNPFLTYRRSPDNYYNSIIQEYPNQDHSSSGTSFYPSNCGVMATTEYFRPSNPPSSPPSLSNNLTSSSRLSSPRGLAISLQPFSAAPSHRTSPDDRAATSSTNSSLLPQSNLNNTSSYSSPIYSNHSGIRDQGVGGENVAIESGNSQDWKRSPHAESREVGGPDSAIGEQASCYSNTKDLGSKLGYSGEAGRVTTSSLSGALAEDRSYDTSRDGSASYQQASSSSQGFSDAFYPQNASPTKSGGMGPGSGGEDTSDLSFGSSKGSGKRASGLPIENNTSFNTSPSSHTHQAQQSTLGLGNSHASILRANESIYVHTFFPDNGEAGIPITIIATVDSKWAARLGLQTDPPSAPRGKVVVSFGNEDVEAKVERSFNPDDGRSQSEFNVNISMAAPSFAETQWTSTRVPVNINIVGLDSNPSDLTLPGEGKTVGEFLYWLVSPRSALKRFGEPLEEEERLENPAKQSSSGLRRPASYPALSGASTTSTNHSSMGMSSESTSNSYGRASGATLNRSISHNRGAGSASSAQAFNPSMQAMRQYRSDMGMSSNSPSQQSQSSFGTGPPTASPGIGSDRISGDFTFSVGRPSSINLPQNGFAGMGISGPSGAISPVTSSRLELSSMETDSRPASAHSASMESPAVSLDDRQLTHSTSINSLNASFNSSFNSMRRGSAGYSPAVAGSSTFSPNSPSTNHMTKQAMAKSAKKSSSTSEAAAGPQQTIRAGSRATLQMHGDLHDMAVGWSHDEYMSSRRLVQFWRRQDGTTIHMTFRPILPHQYVQNSIVISCIFREDRNECFITSVDLIYLLEALVASRFTIEEKNRIRRNLEGFKPSTVAKGKSESAEFFKLIMNFPNPKPRNIEKDVKVFAWSVLGKALTKIIGKYSAAPPSGPVEGMQNQNSSSSADQQQRQHQQQHQPQSLVSNFSPSPSVGGSNQPQFHPSPRSVINNQSPNPQPTGSGAYGHYVPSQAGSGGSEMASGSSRPSGYSANGINYSQDNSYHQYQQQQAPNFKDDSSRYPGPY